MSNMPVNFILLALAIFINNFSSVLSSEGDRSQFYENCVWNCKKKNCTKDEVSFTPEAAQLQDVWARTLGWSCIEECRYHCMWRTVSAYEKRGYPVPKFHGKWPFKRLYGVQEPASAFCSVLNLAAHVYMYTKLVRDKRFSFSTTPLLLFWHLFVAVCVHAWLWSAIFHTRDTAFTEFMDYACALSMIMALFVAGVVRLLYHKPKLAAVVLTITVAYFATHVRYLYTGDVDYEYNMTVNVIYGMLASALWMSYSLAALCRRGGTQRYVWRAVVFCQLSGAAVLLELFDFPPRAHAWDAHALWHLATAPLPLLFYRFVIDDLDYMQTAMKTEKKTDQKLA